MIPKSLLLVFKSALQVLRYFCIVALTVLEIKKYQPVSEFILLFLDGEKNQEKESSKEKGKGGSGDDDVSKYRELKGVMRIGTLAKGNLFAFLIEKFSSNDRGF